MTHLFQALTMRSVTLRNRIGVSPMCMYSSDEGFANDWHLVHLGARAAGGAGLVMMEATAVEPRGRITPADTGLWSDAQVPALQRITHFIKSQGAVAGIQLAHAGRKASRTPPALGDHDLAPAQGGWETVGPSPVPFSEAYRPPHALSPTEIAELQQAFAAAARRADEAGFEWLEIHAAHGYLLHSFLSPLSNLRQDAYGSDFDGRCRFLLETVRAIQKTWPRDKPLTVRISATDWVTEGWTLKDSIRLSRLLKEEEVDLVDCSSGGNTPHAVIPVGASYQVPLAEAVRREAAIATAAVGLITEPMQADDIIRNGRADMVFLARVLLREPQWPLNAAKVLHKPADAMIPVQYRRAFN